MIPESLAMDHHSHHMHHYHEPLEQHSIKIVLVGDIQVGKTSLIQRFIANQLPTIYIPTGFDKYSATFEVGGHHFDINIWDTSGSPTYDTVRPLVYQDTDVFLLCFNLGDWFSLHNVIHKWYPEISKYNSKKSGNSVPIVLVGCQNDQRLIPATNDDDLHIYSPFHMAVTGAGRNDFEYDSCHKRKIVYSQEAMEAARQIGAITFVETCAYSPLTVREAFEVAALASNAKLLAQINSPSMSAHKNTSPFYGIRHFISLSTSSTTVSSPTTSSSQSFDGSSSTGSTKMKSSSSSTHLTRNRSIFKLRKCKSKSDMKHNSCVMIASGGDTSSNSSNSEISKKSCLIM